MAKTRFAGNRRAGKSNITAEALTVLEAQENRTYKQKTEQALIVDDDGNVLLKKRGSKNKVNFTYQETQLMKGNVVTHNHPGADSTFSAADVQTLTRTGMKAMRATGQYGTYMLERGANTNDRQFSKDFRDISDTAYYSNKKTADDSFNDYRKGRITYQDYVDTVNSLNKQLQKTTHSWLKQNASKYGYTYSFERRN